MPIGRPKLETMPQEQYKALGGTVCPFCGGQSQPARNTKPDEIKLVIRLRVYCLQCGKHWDEVYSFRRYEY
jgi:hypothetical protein